MSLNPLLISSAAGDCKIHMQSLHDFDLWLPNGVTSVLVFRDNKIPEHCSTPLQETCEERGIPFKLENLQGGEGLKDPNGWQNIIEAMGQASLDRAGRVVVMGGGSLGDAVGFAASVWHRGTPWLAIPTTLLAMVDAHIGGKTAVHQGGVKNRIGSFHLPEQVIVDRSLLSTLPLEERRQGWAELIKAAWLSETPLLQQLENDADAFSEDLIPSPEVLRSAMSVKVSIVNEDLHESGRREILNLGHTLAHALEMEAIRNGTFLPHGSAVSIGMVFSARLAKECGVGSDENVTRLIQLLQKVGLPTNMGPLDIDPVMKALRSDKKTRGGQLRWVLPVNPGNVIVDTVESSRVRRVLENLERDS